jgi:hypothetical protein
MIPGRYPTGNIKKEGQKKTFITNQNKNQCKTFQNMKTPTYNISMHYDVFGNARLLQRKKIQPCPPTTL